MPDQPKRLFPQPPQGATADLCRYNRLSGRYGLTLTEADTLLLAGEQAAALQNTGRVEFGQGPWEKLIYAFCDSPYLCQANYAAVLAELCALFYRFKSESGEQFSDDELAQAMGKLFNGECAGSLELMADRLWQTLHRAPEPEEDPREGEDTFEE